MATFDDLRRLALALPAVAEHKTWGTDINWRVANKMFAICGDEGSTGVSIKATLDAQEDLLALDPETFTKAAYVGRYGWVNVRLAGVDEALLSDLLQRAWRQTAPKRLLKQLQG
jgi:hypothetical protein